MTDKEFERKKLIEKRMRGELHQGAFLRNGRLHESEGIMFGGDNLAKASINSVSVKFEDELALKIIESAKENNIPMKDVKTRLFEGANKFPQEVVEALTCDLEDQEKQELLEELEDEMADYKSVISEYKKEDWLLKAFETRHRNTQIREAGYELDWEYEEEENGKITAVWKGEERDLTKFEDRVNFAVELSKEYPLPEELEKIETEYYKDELFTALFLGGSDIDDKVLHYKAVHPIWDESIWLKMAKLMAMFEDFRTEKALEIKPIPDSIEKALNEKLEIN